jgi:hypothetical protein
VSFSDPSNAAPLRNAGWMARSVEVVTPFRLIRSPLDRGTALCAVPRASRRDQRSPRRAAYPFIPLTSLDDDGRRGALRGDVGKVSSADADAADKTDLIDAEPALMPASSRLRLVRAPHPWNSSALIG